MHPLLTFLQDFKGANASPVWLDSFGRDDLAGLFAGLGYTCGVEVGTDEGEYAEVLCKANPRLALTCVDAWARYPGYRNVPPEKMASASCRLKPYGVELMQAFSMDAVRHFEDGSLDFVYIDANHELPWVMDDICAWAKKVRPGGTVAGHDYHHLNEHVHAKFAVDAYTQALGIHPWFVLGKDKWPSWFWKKEG